MLIGGPSSHIGEGISVMCGRDRDGIDLLSLTQWPSACSSGRIRARIVRVCNTAAIASEIFLLRFFVISPQKKPVLASMGVPDGC